LACNERSPPFGAMFADLNGASGTVYCAGLRTAEARAVRWSDILACSRAGGTVEIDRVFAAGEIRNTTTIKRGRDVPVIAPLAQDSVAWHAESEPGDADDPICSSRVGTPINLRNWRSRIVNPAAKRVGVGWAAPFTGRTTDIRACRSTRGSRR
jgi:integrase